MDIWNIRWSGDALATVLGDDSEKKERKTLPENFKRKDLEKKKSQPAKDKKTPPPDALAA